MLGMTRHEKYRRLRALRADRHWTQLQLALKAKVTQSRISLIENGYADPTEHERAAIAKAFQLPESEVFSSEALAS